MRVSQFYVPETFAKNHDVWLIDFCPPDASRSKVMDDDCNVQHCNHPKLGAPGTARSLGHSCTRMSAKRGQLS